MKQILEKLLGLILLVLFVVTPFLAAPVLACVTKNAWWMLLSGVLLISVPLVASYIFSREE